jgi:diaminohydroxyphosphoribosylaminopyrimidine deaminase/5-amino-6-(5-phosphoribosylamino)uracil reductase
MERVQDELMALAIAAAGGHFPHPNPRAGAVVVTRQGEVIGRGGHAGPGSPHAEVVALAEAGGEAAGGSLFVTLEPCAHYGRTPPCTDAIIAAGITRVVAAVEDPDPQVAGQGFEALRRADIEVSIGVGAVDALALDPGYFHHRTTGRPRVTLKMAMTLDGQTAAADGTSQWITSVEARQDGHGLRAHCDAVMVGAGTVLADDPALTVRLEGHSGPQPLPVVIAGLRDLPDTCRVFNRDTVVFSPVALDLPAEVVVIPDPSGERVDLAAAIGILGSRGVVDLLIEGGSALATSVRAEGLIDHGVIYVGAVVAGGRGRGLFSGGFATISNLQSVRFTGLKQIGPDIRIDFEGVN